MSTEDIADVNTAFHLLREAGYDDDYIGRFADSAVSILDDYAEMVGEGTVIEYGIARRLGRIELKVFINTIH